MSEGFFPELKLETLKGGIAVAGATASLITLNEWVAIATLIYVIAQLYILIHKHIIFLQDRKKGKKKK